jgi:hypothetical protein
MEIRMIFDRFTQLLDKEIENYLLNRHYVGKKYSYDDMKDVALFAAGKALELFRRDLLNKPGKD